MIPSTVPRLLHLLAPLRGVLSLSIAMRLANHCLGVALLVTAVWGAAAIVTGTVDRRLWPLALTLVGIGFAKGVCRYVEQFTGHYVAFRLLSTLRIRLFDKLEALAPAGLGRDRSGDLLSRAIADIERIEVFYAHTIAPAIIAVAVPAAVLSLLAALDLRLALTVLPFLLAAGIAVPWLTRNLSARAAAGSRRDLADLGSHFADGILGVRDILAFGNRENRLADIDEAGRRLGRSQQRLARAGAFQNGATDLLIGIATAAALATVAGSMARGSLTLPVACGALALVISAFLPILGIANLVPDLEQAMGSARRIFEIFDRTPAVCAPAPFIDVSPNSRCGIRFEGVSFTHPGEAAPTLRDIDLEIPPGSVAAFVGESGSGKSTLARLLLRYWDVTAGRITVLGQDVRRLDPEVLRSVFAVADARTHIFHSTLRENLLLANPSASEADLREALHFARLDGLVGTVPGGLDATVGSLGGKLSGGQRQRLALARAFLQDARVLVLDEATSHLDATREREIQDSINEWHSQHPDRIVLTISHRLESIRSANRIFVLHHGRITASGGYDELAAGEPVFRRLFQLGC